MCLKSFRFTLFAVLLGALHPLHAAAQEADVPGDGGTFEVELNAAEQLENGSCRLTYVITNGSDVALDQTTYEIVFFDTEGIVSQFLTMDFGGLSPGRTQIRRFVFPETPCGSISRILVNDVVACTRAGGGASDLCLDGLVTRSRTPIQFGL
ncbi:hypothetical protein SAMN05444413_110115 [Roseivivax marinus]|uniref:hypothetical protein n=1 Tax=Roseivivax marinus TaxID=1379903 RepID=UPI0008D8A1B3|nr:hypothetical protein [Roseivivax marinus]SEL54750.1 hypothetical protein SAMN05444413_110115 [Roseivivax marinus]